MAKLSQEEVRYRRGIGSTRCANCTMYRAYEPEGTEEAEARKGKQDDESKEPPPTCTDVEGPIDPKGRCDIFDRKE